MTDQAVPSCALIPNQINQTAGLKRDEKSNSKGRKDILPSNSTSASSSSFQANASTYSFSDLQHVYNNCYNGSSNSAPTSGIPPHFYSPILGTQQALLRPLMSTQPPLYSPILNAQQHSYALPHPSPTGCFPSISDSLRCGTLDTLTCPSANNTFKDTNVKKVNDISPSKICDLPGNSYNSDGSKRMHNDNSYNGPTQATNCPELSKNISLHEQRIFEEYFRMYNEEGNCRLWTEQPNACPSSSSSTSCVSTHSVSSSSSDHPTNLVKGSYISQTSSSKLNQQSFPDCRLDPSWNRAVPPNQQSNWGPQHLDEHFLPSAPSKDLSKGSLNLSTGVDHINNRSHYEYQAVSSSSILPYIQSYTQVQEGKPHYRSDVRQVQHQCTMNKEASGSVPTQPIYENKKSQSSNQMKTCTLTPTPHDCHNRSSNNNNAASNSSITSSNSVLPNTINYPTSNNTLQNNASLNRSLQAGSSNVQATNSSIGSSSSDLHQATTASQSVNSTHSHQTLQQNMNLNHLHGMESIEPTNQSSHLELHSHNFPTTLASSNSQINYTHSNNSMPVNQNLHAHDLSNNQINSLQTPNQQHQLAHTNALTNQMPVSSVHINANKQQHPTNHSHQIQRTSHPQNNDQRIVACSSVHHSDRMHLASSHAVPTVLGCLPNDGSNQVSNAHGALTQHKQQVEQIIAQQYPNQSSALQPVNDAQMSKDLLNTPSVTESSSCMGRKFTKSQNTRFIGEVSKKRTPRQSTDDTLQNHNEICIICGIIVDISCHCSIDTPLTIPSKITVGEKLGFMLGCPLPRDNLPSLAVCSKCFYNINEVAGLEHRLSSCHKEVLSSLESSFEKNNIHLYPYKRLQNQHLSGYQGGTSESHSGQFSYSGNSFNLMNEGNMVAYHNDHQQHYQGYFNHNQMDLHQQQHFHNISSHFHGDSQNNPLQMHVSSHTPNTQMNQAQVHMHISQQAAMSQPHQDQHTHQQQHKSQHPMLSQNNPQSFQQKSVNLQTNQESLNLSRQSSSNEIQDLPIDGSTPRQEQHQAMPDVLSIPNQQIQPVLNKNEKNPYQQSHNINQNAMTQPSGCALQQETTHLTCQQQGPLPLTLNKGISQGCHTTPVQPLHLKDKNHETSHSTTQLNKDTKDLVPKQIEDKVSNVPPNSNNDSFVDQNLMIQQQNVSLLLHETPEQLMDHSLSVLLPDYQTTSHDDSSSLLVEGFVEEDLEISKTHITEEQPLTSYTLATSSSNHGSWNEHCNASIIESIPLDPSNKNLQDCNIDIESCDTNIVENPKNLIKKEVPKLNILPSSSENSDCASTSKTSIPSENEISRNSNCISTSKENSSYKGSQDENHHPSSSSPDPNDLDILLSPPSHPPPPLAPPEGLRNVQDATEYHKPTLLGKNLKAKKHAKLQICRQCDQVFSNRQALIRHIERRHKSSSLTYRCDTCHKKFNSEKILIHHIQSHKTYPCKVCNKIFLKLAKLKKHMEEHPQEKLVCKICNKETKTQQAMRSHIKIHEREPKKPFTCQICSSNFTCKRNLLHHMRIHTGDKPFNCGNCKRVFRHESNMIAHYSVCSGKSEFVCHICNKMFSLRSLYKKHLLEHKGHYSHQCSVCNKGFSKSFDLRCHYARHKTASVSYPCSVCGPDRTLICNSQDKHDKTQPETRSSNICHVCGKAISTKISMKNHLARHNGVRNYKCTSCSLSFFYPSNLHSHIQTVHLGIKTHRCSLCVKRFSNPDHLNAHMCSHTGERPFQCKDCGKAFTTNANYKRHQKCHLIRVETQDVEQTQNTSQQEDETTRQFSTNT